MCERVHEQREMEMDRGKKGGRREARETLNEGRDREREEGKERQKVGGPPGGAAGVGLSPDAAQGGTGQGEGSTWPRSRALGPWSWSCPSCGLQFSLL